MAIKKPYPEISDIMELIEQIELNNYMIKEIGEILGRKSIDKEQ